MRASHTNRKVLNANNRIDGTVLLDKLNVVATHCSVTSLRVLSKRHCINSQFVLILSSLLGSFSSRCYYFFFFFNQTHACVL